MRYKIKCRGGKNRKVLFWIFCGCASSSFW